jgi:hypothetical protein
MLLHVHPPRSHAGGRRGPWIPFCYLTTPERRDWRARRRGKVWLAHRCKRFSPGGLIHHAGSYLRSARLLAQWWPLTLIASIVLVFVASYFYATATHALKSFSGSENSCVSSSASRWPPGCSHCLKARWLMHSPGYPLTGPLSL